MKKTIVYIIGAVCFLTVTLLACNSGSGESESGTSGESTAANEGTDNGIKRVELNEAQYKASEIELGTFSFKNLSEVIHANGYTKLPPQNQADVTVLVEGTIKTIKVIEGEYVKKGQTLATVESLEFTKLQQAYLESKSSLEWYSEEYNRQKSLSDENVNAKKSAQKAKSDYESEKARFASLKKQLSILNLQGEGGAVSVMAIKAPISGYVTTINVKIGTTARLGEPLFSIVDNSNMHVDLLVYEKDLQKVKPGQQVRFTLTNQDNTEIMGKIFSVGKAFENETKSVAVHADILNEKQLLIPGMYVNALIDAGMNKVQSLPEEAIVKADGREFIFILERIEEENHEDGHEHVEKGGKGYIFRRVEVKTGTNQLGYIQVTLLERIAPNSKIVRKGAYYIQSHLLKSDGGGGHGH